MSADNMLAFRNFDPVTGRPTIDGFATTDAGVTTTEAEPGYVTGSRLTIGGAGLPPVVIQCIKDGNTLVLGIMCRGDSSFDDLDGVIIGLRQNGTNNTGPQRRIDVFPVWGDAPEPLDPANLGFGYGAANPDPMNAGVHLFEAADNPAFDIRTNKPSHIGPIYYQRGSGSGGWTAYSPGQVADTNKYHVRVRSWKPSVSAGSPAEFAWSIEVRIPVSVATGGADWINLSDDFGLFIDVIRSIRVVDDGDAGYMSTQFKFPLNAPDVTGIIGPGTDIPSTSFGRGLMNGSVSLAEGVRIKDEYTAIGRVPSSNSSDVPTGTISGATDNFIVARLENNGPAASGIRATVRMANWGLGSPDFAAWNPPPGCQNPSPDIAMADGTTTITAATTVNSWPAGSVPSEYAPPKHHQCMWTQLDSTSGGVNFSRSSARRNMDFADLSTEEREAEVSGHGYPKPANGTDQHDFVMFTRCRKIIVKELLENRQNLDPEIINIVGGALQFAKDVPSPDDRPGAMTHVAARDRRSELQWHESVVYIWLTEGFRRTGKFITINKVRSEILDNGPGEFGLVAHHKGIDDNLSWSFNGPGMAMYSPGVYALKVPHKGVTTIGVKLTAEPRGPKGDDSRDLPPAGDKPDGPQPDKPKPDRDPGGDKPTKSCFPVVLALAMIPGFGLATYLTS